MGIATLERPNLGVASVVLAVVATGRALWPRGELPSRLARTKACVTILLAIGFVWTIGGLESDRLEQDIVSPVGLNFYVGNVPEARGGHSTVPGLRDDVVGHRLGSGRMLTEKFGVRPSRWEQSEYWFERTIDHYRGEPLSYLNLLARKVVALFSRETYGLPEQFGVWRWHRSALTMAFVDFSVVLGLVAVALVSGGAACKRAESRVLIGCAALYAMTLLVFLVVERQRLSVLLLLMPIAGLGVSTLWDAVKYRRALVPLLVAGSLFGLSAVSVEVLAPGPGWVSDAQQARRVERERLRRLDPVYEDYVHVPMDDASDRWARMAEYASARGFRPDARAFAEHALKSDDSNVRAWGALLEVFRASRNRSGVEWLVQEISSLQVHSERDRIALRRIHGRALDALAVWK